MWRQAVALIEDDRDVREALAEMLQDEGLEVHAYASGAEALAALPKLSPPPGLLLLDLMMPGMNGWQFCAHRQQAPALLQIPTIVLSADSRAEPEAAQLGVQGFLRKPVGAAALLDAVERYCR